jgi:hypothetical protein
MSDNDSLLSFGGSKFGFDDSSDSKVTEKKRHLCKFDNCDQTFAHYSSRLKHYTRFHSANKMKQKKDTTVNFNSDNVTVNVTERNYQDLTRQLTTTPQIAEVIGLCQSFFNRENTETAISMIKGSKIVEENAIEMRLVC